MDTASTHQINASGASTSLASTSPASTSQDDPGAGGVLSYRLCPRCLRAVPSTSGERYCVNDGTRLLEACPHCGARITSPYSRFCGACGGPLSEMTPTP